MSTCESKVDPIYYANKYNLEKLDNKALTEHYLKTGKQKGYFPNKESEVFYCKKANFDPIYYSKRYCIDDPEKAKEHWITIGYKKGNYVNRCEDLGEHSFFLCRCKIKNSTISKKYEDSCFSMKEDTITSNNTPSESISEIRKIKQNENVVSHLISKSDTETESKNSSNTNNSSTSTNNSSSSTNNSSNTNNSSTANSLSSFIGQQISKKLNCNENCCNCGSRHCIFNVSNKLKGNDKLPEKMSTVNNKITIKPPNIFTKTNVESKLDNLFNKNAKQREILLNNTSYSSNTGKTESEHDSESISCSCTECKNEKTEANEEKTEEGNTKENWSSYEVCSYSVNNDPDGSTYTDSTCDCSVCVSKEKKNEKGTEKGTGKDNWRPIVKNTSKLTAEERKLVEESIYESEREIDKIAIKREQSKNNEENISEEENVTGFIFDQNMKTVCRNIEYITKYIDICEHHVDSVITLFRESYKCLTDVCKPTDNYVLYNTARMKLQGYMKEIDNIIQNSNYDEYPIFFNTKMRSKNLKCIKFPMFITTNNHVNMMLEKIVGKIQKYYKISLIKLSLNELNMQNYLLPLVEKGEIMTTKSNPIPPDDCMVNTNPPRNRYKESFLLERWDVKYHLQLFENALYRCAMYKELLNKANNVIEIKLSLCHKIKLNNLRELQKLKN